MASLKGAKGEFFEITPIAYQFPEHCDNDWDANWLRIQLRASDGVSEWSATDPALLNYEIHELIRWLKGHSEGVADLLPEIGFTEPNIRMEVQKAGVEKRIEVALALNFGLPGPEDSWGGRTIQFPFDPAQVTRFADELQDEVANFPIRVVEKHGIASRGFQGIDKSPPPRGWRLALVIMLAILYGLLACHAYVVVPKIYPLMNVPPNRYVAVPPLAPLAAGVGGFFRAFWVPFTIVFVAIGFLGWKGILDRLIKPLVLLIVFLCVATVALMGYVHGLPEWVRQSYGEEIYRKIFK